MAIIAKKPTKIEALDAEMKRTQERLAELAAEKDKALEEQRDAGRPTLLAALQRVKIGELSKAEAKMIARRIESLGPTRAAELLGAA